MKDNAQVSYRFPNFRKAIRLSNNLVFPAHMQTISRGRNTYFTLILIEFHFEVVFLSVLADNPLKIIALIRFGLIIHIYIGLTN